jgi:hypothetical protein
LKIQLLFSELPEWSIEGIEDVGTFDATGVFIPMGVSWLP